MLAPAGPSSFSTDASSMRSDSSICFMKPCGSGSVAAACCASFNRSARRAGSRTSANCSVKASTLCWDSATTAFLASSVRVNAPLSGRGVHSVAGSRATTRPSP